MSPLEEAKYPDTTVKRLRELAKSDDPDVVRAVTAHPSTPLKLVVALAARFPAAALTHPAVRLAQMEGAAAFKTWPSDSVIALLAHPEAPLELASWAQSERMDRGVWAMGRLASGSWNANSHMLVRFQEAERLWSILDDLPPLKDPEPLGPVFLAGYRHGPSLTLEEVREAASKDEWEIVQAAARNPAAPPAALVGIMALRARYTMGQETLEEAKRASLEHASFPADALREQALATEGAEAFGPLKRRAIEVLVRRGLATPTDVEALAEHPEPTVRECIAVHLTSLELLERLSEDPDHRARRGAARNPLAPPPVLARLASDPDGPVAQAVAERAEHVPEEAWPALATHPRRTVRRAFAATAPKAALAQLIEDPDGLVRIAVAGRKDLGPPLLQRMARDRSALVRRAIAKNGAADVETLEALASDPSATVRDGVSKNKKAPPALIQLAKQNLPETA